MHTKEKILLAALDLFVQQGIQWTSTARICKEVGISSWALFVHFKTKQDLIDKLYLERKQRVISLFESTYTKAGSAKENFLAISKAMVLHFVENYKDYQFFQLLENSSFLSESAQVLYKQQAVQMHAVIEKWRDEGVLKEMDMEFLWQAIWKLLCGIIETLVESGEMGQIDEYVEFVWDATKA